MSVSLSSLSLTMESMMTGFSIDGSEPCQYPTYISIIPLYATENKHGVKYDPVDVTP